MKRLGVGPTNFITPIVRRHIDLHSEVRQRDLARALECSESRIAHIKAGRQPLPAHELIVFCDVYDTTEPLDAMEDRLGREASERLAGRITHPTSLHTLTAQAMRDIGDIAVRLDKILHDGVVAPEEELSLEHVDHALAAIVETARAARDRLPRLPRAARPA